MVAATARPVLVVTEPDDTTADMVIAELNQRGGVPVARLNPGDIGDDLTLSAYYGTARLAGQAGRIRTPSRSVALDSVRSVYWRRPTWPTFDDLPEPDARFAAAQTRHGLGGVLYTLPDCLYVNHPLHNYAAEFKPRQLEAAQRAGLTVPPTLISNDPDEIRAFITSHGKVIYKTLRWTPYSRDGVGMSTWTEPVTAEEIDDSVRTTPHLFQALVEKVADLRVVIVGSRTFAIRIDSGLLDWRRDYDALTYAVVDIPEDVEKQLRAVLDHFQLPTATIDLCLRADGSADFLEINSNGQWGWLEDETGLPITSAFADLLERGTP